MSKEPDNLYEMAYFSARRDGLSGHDAHRLAAGACFAKRWVLAFVAIGEWARFHGGRIDERLAFEKWPPVKRDYPEPSEDMKLANRMADWIAKKS